MNAPNAGRAYVLSGVDGAVLYSIDGDEAGDSLGNGVAGIGDVNGDGVVDLAVAARNAGELNKGLAWIRSGVDGSLIHPLEPAKTGQSFGYFFVRPAGDVDADGVGDVFIPDFADSALGGSTGRGYVLQWRNGRAHLGRDRREVGRGIRHRRHGGRRQRRRARRHLRRRVGR